MSSSIFVNLPVKDLKASMNFYTQIGFTNNAQFTDDSAACMMLNESIFVMLLVKDKFEQFISKPIADTMSTASVINALSYDSKESVNKVVNDALDAGGREPMPVKDLDFMIQRSFEDLDGHLWEAIYMDMSKMPQQ